MRDDASSSPKQSKHAVSVDASRLLTSIQRARYRDRAFLDALDHRLQDITPPPPTEAECLEKARTCDDAARKELEAIGCPPCYPPSVDLPVTLNSLPEPQFGAAKYFQSDGAIHTVLDTQLRHWRMFQEYQQWMRRPGRKSRFKEWIARARKRYRALKLPRTLTLLSDHTRQSMLHNWSEYQEYQLDILQGLKMEEAKYQDQLKAELTKLDPKTEGLYNSVEYSARKIAAQSSLSKWIEWEWYRIAALENPPIQNRRRPDVEIAPTMACTGGRYNLRPRTNGRTTKSQPPPTTKSQNARTKKQPTKNLGLAKTRSGRVSKPVTK